MKFRLLPSSSLRYPIIALLGVFCGLGLYCVMAGNTLSYLSETPETCMNCHVMSPQYATWSHSRHRLSAICTDCHLPHQSLLQELTFKAEDGLRHSAIFTLRAEPQVIRIREAGKRVVQSNCIRCHNQLVSQVNASSGPETFSSRHDGQRLCWDCHRETPHGRVNGLASTPNARVPVLGPVVPLK